MPAMEPLSIVAITLAMICGGACATVLACRVYPLWLLVAAQEHGRFAGLGKSPGSNGPTGRGGIPKPVGASFSLNADRLIVD
jgi:hypothetical protein